MMRLYKEFNQGIAVAICAIASGATLGYIISDCHKVEMKQMKKKYENQINNLKYQINELSKK